MLVSGVETEYAIQAQPLEDAAAAQEEILTEPQSVATAVVDKI